MIVEPSPEQLEKMRELESLEKEKIEEYWNRKITERNASVREKLWLKGAFKGDTLSQNVLKFGSRIAHAAAFSEKTGTGILDALELDRQIVLLKQECTQRRIPLGRVPAFEAYAEPSI